LEGCGCHKGLTNATKAQPILRCKLPPQRPSSLSTKGFLKAEPAFTNLGHNSTTELEAPKHHKAINQQVSRYQSHKSRSRDTREPKTQGPSSKREGKSNRFGEDVDQGLLLRFSKDQELWWVEGGDLANLVAPNGVFFLCRTSSLRWKKGRGIYSPSQNVAVADLEGQIIRPKYGRIIRLAGLSAPLTGKSGPFTG
jgi:hypothetical protein